MMLTLTRISFFKSFIKYTLFISLYLTTTFIQADPTTADYSALPSIQMMRISPSGDMIAFRRQTEGKDILSIYSILESKSIRNLDIADINPVNFFFINNTQLIFKGVNERRVDGFKGMIKMSTAFVLDIQTGDIRQLLTPGKGVYLGQSGLGDIVAVSENGKLAYMPAFRLGRKHGTTPDYSLMSVRLTKVATPRPVEVGEINARDYFMDGKGNTLAMEVYDEKRNVHQIDVKDKASKSWRTIFEQKTPYIDYNFRGLTEDRTFLVFIQEDANTGYQNLFKMSLTDGSIVESKFGRADADIEDTIMDINRVLYGVQYSGFKPSYQFFDSALDKRMNNIVQTFPTDSVLLIDHSPDWKHILVKVTGPTSPGDFFLFSLGVKKPLFLASARPNIKIQDIHPSTAIAFKARDGLNIPLLLTTPRNKINSLKNLPAIMLPHGGPESHDTIDFDWLSQSFANQGYLVIQPQFRGSDGFGLQHLLAGRGEWGQKMQDDITDSFEYLAKAGIINRDKVCIVGWSYGGYAALAGAVFTPDLYQCAASINGVSELNKFIKTEKSDHGRDSQILAYWQEVTAKGKTGKDELLKISPAAHADKIKAPVLLFHADKDRSVNIDQAATMYKAMKKAKKNVAYIKIKNDGHYLLEQENRTMMLDELIKFINKHIGSN